MPKALPTANEAPDLELKSEYQWRGADHAHNHQFLLPALNRRIHHGKGQSLIDLGCGNGALTAHFARQGFRTVGTEIAESGLHHARRTHPDVTFHPHDLNDELPPELRSSFDVALSAEVIEHLLLPRELFRRAQEALHPNGLFVVTTPYHGWLKNMALAVTNRFDQHWSPGWDHGHVKFFSRKTLTTMAEECGFRVEGFDRVGRIPQLAMSMILVMRKSAS